MNMSTTSGGIAMMLKRYKKLIALFAVVAMAALAGCTSAPPDSRQDFLPQYDSNVYLPPPAPFETRNPELDTPSPAPTPEATLAPVDQGWQNDGDSDSTPITTYPPAAVYVQVEQGSQGDDVKRLQERLIELGYLTGTADGSFGQQTRAAVLQFQARLGVSQTGIATASVQERLYQSDAPRYGSTSSGANVPQITARPVATPPPSGGSSNSGSNSGGNSSSSGSSSNSQPYSTLSSGSSGAAVTRLQQKLIELGYLSGTADGKFGTQTTNAVKQFQKALGAKETGSITGYQQERLYASNAPKATPKPTATPTYVNLEPGDSGARVKSLQTRLKTLGYFSGDADGNYYASTTEAVKRFQAALGISQTGTADVSLQTKIFASNAPAVKPTATPAPTGGQYIYLAPGSNGPPVKSVQNRLIALGYLSGAADGDYGSKTTAAVKRFQAALGLDETGIATGSLQEKLFADNAPEYRPPATATPAPTATINFVKMQPGDTGNRVKTLQRRLQELGYFDGDIGGNYLEKTTTAVKKFQAAIGMKVDGIASVEMQQRLFSGDAPAARPVATQPPPTPTPAPTATINFVKMQPGDTGNRVKALQRRMQELGYFDGDIGGNYLEKTTTAVKKFQAAIGMKEDGIASVEMQERLFADDAPYNSGGGGSTGTGYTALKAGDNGNAVRNLQTRLIQLGYLDGKADGDYGAKTVAAVKVFQRAIGEDTTGNASAALQERLFSNNAPPYASSGSGTTSVPGSFIKLQFGDSGDEVRNLQKRLAMLGYYDERFALDSPGSFGDDTLDALISFQLALGNSGQSVDGIATVDLQRFLFSDEALEYAYFEPAQ